MSLAVLGSGKGRWLWKNAAKCSEIATFLLAKVQQKHCENTVFFDENHFKNAAKCSEIATFLLAKNTPSSPLGLIFLAPGEGRLLCLPQERSRFGPTFGNN